MKFKITKGSEVKWEKWQKAKQMVENEGWEFVMNGPDYVCQDPNPQPA